MRDRKKKRLVSRTSQRVRDKVKNFKRDQEEKYHSVKAYFASDEEMDDEKFVAKEKRFILDTLKLILYLSIILVIYFLLLR
ncbi:hypothetical protein AB9M75_10840 [Lactobacillus sp. AN1001]